MKYWQHTLNISTYSRTSKKCIEDIILFHYKTKISSEVPGWVRKPPVMEKSIRDALGERTLLEGEMLLWVSEYDRDSCIKDLYRKKLINKHEKVKGDGSYVIVDVADSSETYELLEAEASKSTDTLPYYNSEELDGGFIIDQWVGKDISRAVSIWSSREKYHFDVIGNGIYASPLIDFETIAKNTLYSRDYIQLIPLEDQELFKEAQKYTDMVLWHPDVRDIVQEEIQRIKESIKIFRKDLKDRQDKLKALIKIEEEIGEPLTPYFERKGLENLMSDPVKFSDHGFDSIKNIARMYMASQLKGGSDGTGSK